MLAQQLAKGEGRAWAQAVEASEPFELSVWRNSGGRLVDTYMPTGRAYGDSAVYRGIAGGLAAYACDPSAHGPVWAFSSTILDEMGQQDCEGELWIDKEAGQAYAQLDRSESSRVPLSFGLGLDACAGHAARGARRLGQVVRRQGLTDGDRLLVPSFLRTTQPPWMDGEHSEL